LTDNTERKKSKKLILKGETQNRKGLKEFFPDKMKTLNEKKRSNINDFALLRRRVDERTRDYTSRRTEEEE
jgi:hypothetical protein